MRRAPVALLLVVFFLVLGTLVVVAQSGQLHLLQPAVVNVQQAVPVNVTLGGVVNGQQVTLTAPMTMNVAVQVQIVGGAGAVVAASAAPAQGVAAAAQPTPAPIRYDSRGVPYRSDVRPPFALLQVESVVDSIDEIDIVGEIQNTGPDTYQYVEVAVTFYKDGKIIHVDTAYASLDELVPGRSSPFKMSPILKADKVNAYTVQVAGAIVRE